jgi:formylglycine-generating enzyme required for sulfatase activity
MAACRGIIGYEDGVPFGVLPAGSDASSRTVEDAPPRIIDASAQEDVAVGDDEYVSPDFIGDIPCVEAGAADAGTPPSCQDLAWTCGPSGSDDCCASTVIDGGKFNIANRPSLPAGICTYRLDAYEVTVGRFRKFVAAYSQTMLDAGAGRNPNVPGDTGWVKDADALLPQDSPSLQTGLHCDPPWWTWTDNDAGQESLPINCVSWWEAFAFCAWDGARLPTQAEWDYATVGGSDQRTYPWGEAPPDATRAVVNCNHGACGDARSFLPVGSLKAGNGKWGQADMEGNVAEWVWDGDCNLPRPCVNCACLATDDYRLVVGSAYGEYGPSLVAGYTYATSSSSISRTTGLRCARAP